jgi:hypothetical protein
MTEQEWLTTWDYRDLLGFIEAHHIANSKCCARSKFLLVAILARVCPDLFFVEGWTSRALDAETVEREEARRAFEAIGLCEYLADLPLTKRATNHELFDVIGLMDYAENYEEVRRITPLFRDIFGNPFRPVTFNAAWRTSTVTNLAAAIYEDRHLPSGLFDNQRMAVLADALEDAGCDSTDILGHLRGGGEHVRGCHVIDLVLGKE